MKLIASRLIDELIAEYEADPKWAAELKEARKEIAQRYYKPGDPQYDRLMRGEGKCSEKRTHTDDRISPIHS